MGEHSSYHQSIPGDEAERRLRRFGGHCYLTRYSETRKCYVLSVFENQKPYSVVRHFKIIKKDGKFNIYGKSTTFDDLQSMLTHYEQNRIDPALRSIGHEYEESVYIKSLEFCSIL